MDTKKVQELLRQIEAAEAKLQELKKNRAELDARIQAQDELASELKRQLAEELREVVGPVRGMRRARKAQAGERERATGLSEALLSVLADGKTHSVQELRTAVAAKGLSADNVGLALAYLAKKGRITRVGRGEYRQTS